jgi:hypothetical protein
MLQHLPQNSDNKYKWMTRRTSEKPLTQFAVGVASSTRARVKNKMRKTFNTLGKKRKKRMRRPSCRWKT